MWARLVPEMLGKKFRRANERTLTWSKESRQHDNQRQHEDCEWVRPVD